MRKTIKSGKEIWKEIDSLFLNFKNDSELFDRINSYLEKVTGKELYSKRSIKSRIQIKLLLYILSGTLKLKNNSPIFAMFPLLSKLSIRKNRASRDLLANFIKDLDIGSNMFTYQFLLSVFSIWNDEKFDQSNNYSSYKFDNKAFLDLLRILDKNIDISILLYFNLHKTVRESVIDLIIGNIVPLKTLLIFFNRENNVKDNTQALYLLCRKKIPRTNIQQVITDNINSIRNGDFEGPFTFTKINPVDKIHLLQ